MRPKTLPPQFTQGRPLTMKEALVMARKIVVAPSPKLTGAARVKALRDYDLMLNKTAMRLVQESLMRFKVPAQRLA
jgi:hypothetical protein